MACACRTSVSRGGGRTREQGPQKQLVVATRTCFRGGRRAGNGSSGRRNELGLAVFRGVGARWALWWLVYRAHFAFSQRGRLQVISLFCKPLSFVALPSSSQPRAAAHCNHLTSPVALAAAPFVAVHLIARPSHPHPLDTLTSSRLAYRTDTRPLGSVTAASSTCRPAQRR